MRTAICLILLTCVLGIYAEYPTFEEYMIEYNKTYTEDEIAIHQPIYNDRIQVLNTTYNYIGAVNKFTDWNDTQLAELKGLKTVPVSERSRRRRRMLTRQKLGQAGTVDWRNQGGVSPIKDQGTQCKGSWAFATIAYAESKLMIVDDGNNLAAKDLSQQRLLGCTQQSTCNGGYIEYAMEALENGVLLQQELPYDPDTSSSSAFCSKSGISVGSSVKNYYDIDHTELKEMVAYRPVVVSILADEWQNYGSGTFQCSSTSNSVNHAVLVVGYTDNYWIIKNSWGEDWGQNGYMRLSTNPSVNCNMGYSAHKTFQYSQVFTFVSAVLLMMMLV